MGRPAAAGWRRGDRPWPRSRPAGWPDQGYRPEGCPAAPARLPGAGTALRRAPGRHESAAPRLAGHPIGDSLPDPTRGCDHANAPWVLHIEPLEGAYMT